MITSNEHYSSHRISLSAGDILNHHLGAAAFLQATLCPFHAAFAHSIEQYSTCNSDVARGCQHQPTRNRDPLACSQLEFRTVVSGCGLKRQEWGG